METKKLILFVNGYTLGCKPLKPYWTEHGAQFLDAANDFFGGTCTHFFLNGEGAWYSSAKGRKNLAIRELKNAALLSAIRRHEEIFIVTHSMGAAYAEGLLEIHDSLHLKTKLIVHFSPSDAHRLLISDKGKIKRLQMTLKGDRTLNRRNFFVNEEKRKIAGVSVFLFANPDLRKLHPKVGEHDIKKWDSHYDTKTFAYVWEMIRFMDQMLQMGMGVKFPLADCLVLELNGRRIYTV